MRIIFVILLLFLFTLRADAEPTRPLVFVPGIVGSKLCKGGTGENCEGGRLLWGDAWSLNNIKELTIPRGPRSPDDGVRANAIIDKISIFGLIKIEDYAETLYPILKGLGYAKGNMFYEFPYDWRASTYDTARQLKDFLDQPPLKDRQVDIIAHSMGGLVAQIYIKNLGGDRRVVRLVNLAVPFLGSPQSLHTLTDGWGWTENQLAGGLETIQKFALSMPSFYELLPEYQYCCILGRPDDANRKPYPVLTDNGWGQIKWATQDIDPAALSAALQRARDLRQLASKPYPSGVSVYNFAGAKIDTAFQFYADHQRNEIALYRPNSGDGTVPEVSASNGGVPPPFVSFAPHQTVFNDPAAITALGRIFCEAPCGVPTQFAAPSLTATSLNGNTVQIKSVGLTSTRAFAKPNEAFPVELRVLGDANTDLDKLAVSVEVFYLDGGSAVRKETRSLTAALESNDVAFYKAMVGPLTTAGRYRLNINVKGMPSVTDFLIVSAD